MPLSRDDLRGKVQTVGGLIDPAGLGATLMHEHLLWDIRTPAMQASEDQGPPLCPCTYFVKLNTCSDGQATQRC